LLKKLKGYSVTQFNIFIIRAVIGAVVAVVLTRMFYGKVEIVYVAGLAVFLVGMAYAMEYFRKKRKDG
jgi:Flp pilus assembly protein TadB